MHNKIGIVSLGCPKALVDLENIVNLLIKDGYQLAPKYQDANIVIVNTCGFINAAIEESLAAIAEALEQNGKVIVTGCLGARKETVLKKYPQILAIFGPNEVAKLIKTIHQFLPITAKNICQNAERQLRITPRHYAYLKISEGCNNKCTFCIIPQLRGKLKSRPIKEIIKEAKYLVKNGVKELILVAQDTLMYGKDLKDKNSNIINLINQLSKLGVWLRLHYLYPYPQLDELLPLISQHKILPYIDVPLQHVNRRILTAMHRPGDKKNLLQRIENWRKICPDVTIRSTFIVGFPGETTAEFNELLEFLKEAKIDRVGAFAYSPVEGAKANILPKQVSSKTKSARIQKLMLLQQEISKQKLAAKIGKKIEIIIDKVSAQSIIGRTEGDAPDIDGCVHLKFRKNLHPGDIIKIKILANDDHDLYATTL
jgi:ribosomal protein S12 methylthiotransferase